MKCWYVLLGHGRPTAGGPWRGPTRDVTWLQVTSRATPACQLEILRRWSTNATVAIWMLNHKNVQHNIIALCNISTKNYYEVTWAIRRLKSLATRLFDQQFVQDNKWEHIETPHCWFFIRKIHQSSVNCPSKGPAMRNTFPCYDVTIRI